MSSRRRRGTAQDLLGEENTSMKAVADRGYGTSVEFEADRKRVPVKLVSIFEVAANAMQPRRALPSLVRKVWNGTPETVAEALIFWHERVEEERGGEFVLGDYLEQGEFERPEPCGPLEAVYLELVALAASIRRDGLTNPITVFRQGKQFMIETGERRWLTYHLLNAFYKDDDQPWLKIPARVMGEFNLWRQAAENNARDDLNAIARARQLALVLMDLHGWEHFRSHEELVESGECDRAFYAQVADGEAWPIPWGKSEMVLQATNFKSRKQFRNYRALLRLPDDVWIYGDDENWTEGRLRRFTTSVPIGTQDDADEKFKASFGRTIGRFRKDAKSNSSRRAYMIQQLRALLDEILSMDE